MSESIAQCPQCFHRVLAPAEPIDKWVCSSCEFVFAPKAEEPSRKNLPAPVARAIPRVGPTPAAPLPVAKPTESARATPIKRADGSPRGKGDDEGSRPRSRRRDDGKDERPRKRRQRDEADDKPAKKKGGSALPIILIVGGLLAVLMIGGGVAVVASVMGSSPVANATAPASSQVPPTKPAEPDWIEPNRLNGPGGLGKGLGGDFQQPGGLDAVPQPDKLNDVPQPGRPGGINPGRRGGGIPVRPDAPPVEPWNPQADKPKQVVGETEVKLPGTVADTCSGGSGRYFILHLNGKKQLAVFDVTQSKVVKYIPLTSDSVKFAAGQDKLIVAYPDDGVLARFDLTTFEKEVTAKSPVDSTIRQVCMGSASNGPLLVSSSDGQRGLSFAKLTFLDPLTFKSVGIDPPENRGFGMIGLGGDKMHYRASPDGTLFGAWSTAGSPTGMTSITVRGKKATAKYEHDSTGYVVPGADGRIYTGQGLFTAELKKLSKQPGADQWGRAAYLPAVDGNLYLHVSTQGGNGIGGGLGGVHMNNEMMKADVRMDGDGRSLFTFKDLGPFGTDAWTGSDFTSDKRIHFHPSAHLLVTVPQTNDRFLLRKFDLEAAFNASGVDYLYVNSRPPAAVRGKGYEYQIAVRSKKGGVKYKLDAGPTGLKVSDSGKVTWTAPSTFSTPEQVIITISDASKQEIFHTFELVPAALKGAGPEVEKPGNPPKGGDKEAFVGTWEVETWEVNGSKLSLPEQTAKARYTFDKNGGVRFGGGLNGPEMSGAFTLDPSATPKTIDIRVKPTPSVEETREGVYEVSGDTLRMSFSSIPIGARPKDLQGGLQVVVMVLKRVADEPKKEEPKKPIDQLPKKEEPSGSIPSVNPPVAPAPKGPIKSVVAAPFDTAWAEYVKRTGLAPASFSGEVVEIGLAGLPGWPVNAGGGRYLAIPIALKKVVQVVDLGTAKVAFELPYDASKQAVAANLTHVFVRDASAKNITRYALATGKSDKSADLDLGTEAGVLVAASASADAPLLVCGNVPKRVFTALDPNTLTELPDLLDTPGQASVNGALHLSADGNRVLIQLVNDPDRRHFHLGTRTGDKFTWQASGIDRPPARSTRGFHIAGTGTVSHWTNIYNPTASEELKVAETGFPPIWRSVGGGPLCGVLVPPERDKHSQFALTSGPAQPRLFLTGLDVKPNDVIAHVSEPLGVIAHFGENSNRLVVRKFDLKKLTEASPAKEPLIALAPPPAQRGQVFTCTPAVLAKGKKVALALADGPDGMTLTDAGVLEWVVPVNFPDPFATVTLTATTAGGEKSTLTIYPAVTGAKR